MAWRRSTEKRAGGGCDRTELNGDWLVVFVLVRLRRNFSGEQLRVENKGGIGGSDVYFMVDK